MKSIIATYRNIERHIMFLIIAEFFVQFVNAAFFLLLNYYMLNEGYADFEIAKYVKVRFLAVMLLAFPLGLYIKGRKLRPVFTIGIIMLPVMALMVIFSIQWHIPWLLYVSMMLWGISFALIQITALPYILLNAKKETHSEVIALFFQCWVLGTVIVGFVNYGLNNLFENVFDDRNLLIFFSSLGFIGCYFVLKIKHKENVSERINLSQARKAYDWNLIFRIIVPTFIIAIGAGFTIPFINLFFESVHGIQSATFSLMGATTYVLVAFGVFFIPSIKRKYGYEIAITLIQALSVVVLILMATTEWYQHLWFAVYIAVFFYIMRQPLMNVAGPMTSELAMYYVGKKNREIVSAITASIWSGSWFVSANIFQVLRQHEIPYSTIFLFTALLYAIGVVFYYLLIKDFNKRKEAGLIIID